MIRRPEAFRVGPFCVAVQYPVESELSDNANDGVTMWTNLLVQIDGRMIASRQADVMMHEVIHCISRVIGVHPNGETMLSEEDICLRYSASLLKFIVDNPHVIKFFREATGS